MAFIKAVKRGDKTYYYKIHTYRDQDTGKVRQRLLRRYGTTRPPGLQKGLRLFPPRERRGRLPLKHERLLKGVVGVLAKDPSDFLRRAFDSLQAEVMDRWQPSEIPRAIYDFHGPVVLASIEKKVERASDYFLELRECIKGTLVRSRRRMEK